MLEPQQIKHWIEESLENSEVIIDGDGHHFGAMVICDDFEGKNTIARHRMVYNALGDKMKQTIHALSMKTLTRNEYNNSKSED